jgi:hypothetical protein
MERSGREMKQIQNRQKRLVQPRERKPRESVNFKKLNRLLKKRLTERVSRNQE